jgi:hypothetical protein
MTKLLNMKTRRIYSSLCWLFLVVGTSNEVKAQQISVNFSSFYNELGHYGRWVNNPHYGQVWVYSEPGFRPYYSAGHWDYTDYGWSWVSNYDWGWAPFHYGRWEEDPMNGWIWIPGYDWAPAWVSWSEYDGYYGWAPMGYGVNINVNFGSIPYNRWVFVPRQRICEANVYNYYVQPKNRYFRNAVIINNYNYNGGSRYWAGPRKNEVERYTQRPIQSRAPQWGRSNGVNNNDRGWANRDNNQYNRDRGNVGDHNQNNSDRGWNNRDNSQHDRDRGNVRDHDQNNNNWNNRDRSNPRQNQDDHVRNNNGINNTDRPANNNGGVNNNRPQPVQSDRQWENHHGRPDQNITRDNSPQPQNPSRNIGQSGNNNPRPVMPNRPLSGASNTAPRAFGNHNNGVMRTAPANNQGGNDNRGVGNVKRR